MRISSFGHRHNNLGDRSLPNFLNARTANGLAPTFDNEHKLFKCYLKIYLT